MTARGEVYDVDFGEPIGHEPAFIRPAIIVSTDAINQGSGEVVIVIAVTSRGRGLRSHVELQPGAALTTVSYACCDQVRSISTQRLLRLRGITTTEETHAIDRALRFVLGL